MVTDLGLICSKFGLISPASCVTNEIVVHRTKKDFCPRRRPVSTATVPSLPARDAMVARDAMAPTPMVTAPWRKARREADWSGVDWRTAGRGVRMGCLETRDFLVDLTTLFVIFTSI